MTLRDELSDYVLKTVASKWSERDGQKVPDTSDLTLSNDAVKLTGTVLYADLAGSTELVKRRSEWLAAEVYKTYLYCAARLIRTHGGVVTAYDGDRVMGVFINNENKNSKAAKCGLQINWAVREIINPAIASVYGERTYQVSQRVGIDTSELFVARTGVRGSNDLVWVGNAANIAAKLAARPTTYKTYITADVYSSLLDYSKYGGDPRRDMWTDLGYDSTLGRRVYGSTWRWEF